MAVALAQPTDVVKVRFQAQVSAGAANKCYQGTMDAYRTIAKKEGFRGLWKGKAETCNICGILVAPQFGYKCNYYLFFRNWPKHHPQCHCELY